MAKRLPRLEQVSLADRAYTELKAAILSGQFASGAQMAEVELASALGISRTPVREALARLRSEGLVVALTSGGNAVHAPSDQEDRELFMIREVLEQLAVKQLTEASERVDITQLDKIIEEQKRAKSSGNAERFLDADERFHIAICRLAGLNQTADILVSLRQRMRLAGLGALTQSERQSLVLDEHAAIVKAVRARDSARAVAAVRHHLGATRAALDEYRHGDRRKYRGVAFHQRKIEQV